MNTRLRRNAVSAFLLFCVQGEEDSDCGPRDRCICLQRCTRIRNFCTFIYNYHARTYNYGKTFCKNDDPAADGGIFVSFTDLKANCKRDSMLLEAVLAEDSLLQYNKSWKSVDL